MADRLGRHRLEPGDGLGAGAHGPDRERRPDRRQLAGEFDDESGADLNSAFYVPVYDLTLCSAVVYKVCNQVWRWNLDRVEDTNWLRGRPYEVRTWNAGSVLASRQTTDYSAVLTVGSDPVDPPQPPPPAPPVCGAYSDAAHFVAAGETKGYTYDAAGANLR